MAEGVGGPVQCVVASRDDRERLLTLMREFYAIEHLEYRDAFAEPALDRLLAGSSDGVVWTIQVCGDVVGYLALTFGFVVEFGGRVAVVDELYVREAYRGRGVGTAALQCAEQYARSLGLAALRLEVDRTNARAQLLYARVGFSNPGRDILTKRLDSPAPIQTE